MRIITLLTDWRKDDYYKAVLKATIYSQVSDVQFVDISHQVDLFHIPKASFLLSSAVHQFPKGSIHLFGIQSVGSDTPRVIVGKINDQYIIANDNGIFEALNLPFDQLRAINVPVSNFPMVENFAPIAIDLIQGKPLVEIGDEIEKAMAFKMLEATVEEDRIICPVTYIDSYGNLMLNLQKSFFEKHRKERRFDILINSFKYKTSKIHQHYNEVPKSEIFSIFNSAGWLEIGMRMANISQVLNLSEKSNIIIKFYND